MRPENIAVLRAPDPLGYRAAKKVNTACQSPGGCTSSGPLLTNIGPFLPFWSKVVQAESVHLDHKPRAIAGLVQVVQVVQAKSHIIHMRARAYASIFFLNIISFLTLKFDFIRNHLDHLDQANASLHSRLDHPLGPPWTTWTTSMPERVSAFSRFVGGGRQPKTGVKWSDNPRLEACATG